MSNDASVNIKKPSILPYWFVAAGAGLFGLISWATRGVSFWTWICVGIFSVSALIAIALRHANKSQVDWRRNLLRLALFGMVAATGGFIIHFFFALAVVYVENDNPFDIRLTLDGDEWLAVPAKSQTKTKLTKGTYTVVVLVEDGRKKVDEHSITVAGHGTYMLNVLGSQTYFRGEVVYGMLAQSPPVKEIRDKWFEFGRVDYLFQDPPEIVTLPGGPTTTTKRSYMTRGAPPVFKGREKKD